jgi:hypothetical protein
MIVAFSVGRLSFSDRSHFITSSKRAICFLGRCFTVYFLSIHDVRFQRHLDCIFRFISFFLRKTYGMFVHFERASDHSRYSVQKISVLAIKQSFDEHHNDIHRSAVIPTFSP